MQKFDFAYNITHLAGVLTVLSVLFIMLTGCYSWWMCWEHCWHSIRIWAKYWNIFSGTHCIIFVVVMYLFTYFDTPDSFMTIGAILYMHVYKHSLNNMHFIIQIRLW